MLGQYLEIDPEQEFVVCTCLTPAIVQNVVSEYYELVDNQPDMVDLHAAYSEPDYADDELQLVNDACVVALQHQGSE